MPILSKRSVPAEDPEYRYTSWLKGLNTTQAKNKIKRDEMSDAQNVEIKVDSIEKRLGTQYLGNAKDSRTRGLAMYSHSDGVKKIIRSSGTTLQVYNTATGDFDDITGKTYTSDLNTDYILANDDLFIFNGTDNLTKYNKDDATPITTYVAIGPPTSPSAARGAGLADGQFTAFYKLTHYNSVGETVATSEFSVTFNILRSNWDTATKIATLSWTNDGGTIVGTNIYYSSTSGDETYLTTLIGTDTSYIDYGDIEADGITEPPETNSTGGVIAFKGDFDGTRVWAFSGSTLHYSGPGAQNFDKYDSGSGGGALSVSKGDGDEIKKVVRTRDGSVIIYKEFSIWKVYFSSTGIITLRNVNSFIGCVGKRAAITVDDDQVFLSRFGMFTLGNQPNFPTDILRVKNISYQIENELQKITPSNLPNTVLHYDFQRRLRLSFTEGGATFNNAEFIFKFGAWFRNTSIAANCYLNFTDVVSGTPVVEELSKAYTFYGSDDEGRVVQLDKGYSDRGGAIDAYFDTNQDDQGKPERSKKYYDQDVEVGKLQGNLTITQFFDSGADIEASITNNAVGGMGAEAVGFSAVGSELGSFVSSSSVSLSKRWRLFGRQQRNIRTRFRQNSASGTFSIFSFSGVFRLKSRRQYDSADVLTTTEV